jgi:hypothetical protein
VPVRIWGFRSARTARAPQRAACSEKPHAFRASSQQPALCLCLQGISKWELISSQKQRSIRTPSNQVLGAGKAVFAKRMYYYMVLVLDPEFSAEETRTAKAYSLYKNCKGRKGRKLQLQRKLPAAAKGGRGRSGPSLQSSP